LISSITGFEGFSALKILSQPKRAKYNIMEVNNNARLFDRI